MIIVIVLIDGNLNADDESLNILKWTDFTLGHRLQEIQNLKEESDYLFFYSM